MNYPITYKSLFGPVPSRRLGLSLGIDLIPYKTCSLDCIYCESGATTKHTIERKVYRSTADVMQEIHHFLENSKKIPDYFTFSGSGEPTLAANLGEVIAEIKALNLPSKIALLTNSTLLKDPKLRKEINPCDLIVPSLDAMSETAFQKINRPEKTLKAIDVFDGILSLSKEFQGKIWLEVFILPGINDSQEELTLLKNAIQDIQPDKVQLNTLDRPGAVSGLEKAPRSLLEEIKAFWNLNNVEIVSSYSYLQDHDNETDESFDELTGRVLGMIIRRPCTVHDLAESLNQKVIFIQKVLDGLLKDGKIIAVPEARGLFFKPKA